MVNEIILSKRIPAKAILSGEVNHFIRIADKQKWKNGSLFELKSSYRSNDNLIEIIVVNSEEVVANCIPEDVLRKCYYRNREEFKTKWEDNWYQQWEGKCWLIKFKLRGRNEN